MSAIAKGNQFSREGPTSISKILQAFCLEASIQQHAKRFSKMSLVSSKPQLCATSQCMRKP